MAVLGHVSRYWSCRRGQFEIKNFFVDLVINRLEGVWAMEELSYLEFKKILLSLYDDLKIFNQ